MDEFFGIAWKKLFPMYYNVEISEQFIKCADSQLSQIFENETGLKINKIVPIHLTWSESEQFKFETGDTSKLYSKILLKYGWNDVSIHWKSKTGKIYEFADTAIVCNDIEFWFEGLDPALCRQLVLPKWSLIPFKDFFINYFSKNSSLKISKEFTECADNQLTKLFEKKTGINTGRLTSLSPFGVEFNYKKDKVSSIQLNLALNIYGNPVTVLWKSNSGRIYELSDTNIDCNDIEFWMEGINVMEFNKQMFPNVELPFKLKELTYELNIIRINADCIMEMFLKAGELGKINELIQKVDGFISKYNEKSLKKDRADGIIHNWKRHSTDQSLIYEIDLGSTEAVFMKKILRYLSSLDSFIKIEIS